MTVYPWQKQQQDIILNELSNNKLAHAYLFAGLPGVGKNTFASYLVETLLCNHLDNQQQCCQQCQSYLLLQAETHPDYKLITPEEQGKAIKVDQIRELNEFATKTAQIANRKVVVITPADAMNTAAANALLKTLEEPASNTIIILVSSQINRLPATVRSRCQLIKFDTPSNDIAKVWLSTQTDHPEKVDLLLNLSYGAPLRALELMSSDELELRQQCFIDWLSWQRGKMNFSELVANWNKQPMDSLFLHFYTWLADLLKCCISANQQKLINVDFTAELNELAARLDLQAVIYFINFFQTKYQLLQTKISINQQLLIEEILIRWIDVVKARRG